MYRLFNSNAAEGGFRGNGAVVAGIAHVWTMSRPEKAAECKPFTPCHVVSKGVQIAYPERGRVYKLYILHQSPPCNNVTP
jgi:hypothetical protein